MQSPDPSIPPKLTWASSWVASINWIFAFLWILTLPQVGQEFNSESRTLKQLDIFTKEIQRFYKSNKKLPKDLRQVYLFSSDRNFLSLYDSFGFRLNYLPLTTEHFILRSFGHDGEASNLLSAPDIVKKNLPPSQNRITIDHDLPLSRFYPLQLASGSQWKDRYSASVLTHSQNGQTHLIIEELKSSSPRLLLAPHDHISEYYWWKQGTQIIYASSGSNKYQDGIFLWDLKTNQVKNLFEKNSANAIYRKDSAFSFHLVGVDPATEIIWAFVYDLNQLTYFSRAELDKLDYLRAVNITGKSQVTDEISRQNTHKLIVSQTLLKDMPLASLSDGEQSSWSTLFAKTPIPETLKTWTDFCEKIPSENLGHYYCVFYLSFLYADAAILLSQNNTHADDQEKLKAMASQLAIKVARSAATPIHLNIFAQDLADHLLKSTLPYPNLSGLESHSD